MTVASSIQGFSPTAHCEITYDLNRLSIKQYNLVRRAGVHNTGHPRPTWHAVGS